MEEEDASDIGRVTEDTVKDWEREYPDTLENQFNKFLLNQYPDEKDRKAGVFCRELSENLTNKSADSVRKHLAFLRPEVKGEQKSPFISEQKAEALNYFNISKEDFEFLWLKSYGQFIDKLKESLSRSAASFEHHKDVYSVMNNIIEEVKSHVTTRKMLLRWLNSFYTSLDETFGSVETDSSKALQLPAKKFLRSLLKLSVNKDVLESLFGEDRKDVLQLLESFPVKRKVGLAIIKSIVDDLDIKLKVADKDIDSGGAADCVSLSEITNVKMDYPGELQIDDKVNSLLYSFIESLEGTAYWQNIEEKQRRITEKNIEDLKAWMTSTPRHRPHFTSTFQPIEQTVFNGEVGAEVLHKLKALLPDYEHFYLNHASGEDSPFLLEEAELVEWVMGFKSINISVFS